MRCTVPYLHQEDAFERMQDTLALWELFRQRVYEVYISDIVLREIDQCTEEKLSAFGLYETDKVSCNRNG